METISAQDFAERINVKPSTVYKWLKKGWVAGAEQLNVGKLPVWLVPVSAVEEFKGKRPKRGAPKGKRSKK